MPFTETWRPGDVVDLYLHPHDIRGYRRGRVTKVTDKRIWVEWWDDTGQLHHGGVLPMSISWPLVGHSLDTAAPATEGEAAE